jgi:lauroyl/myristoyl acyltransferase
MAFRLGQGLVGRLPAPVTRRVAEGGAVMLSHRPGRPGRESAWATRRRLVGSHIERVLVALGEPRPSRLELGRLVDRAMASYARYWTESLRLPLVDAGELAAGMTYDGFGHVERARAAGRGTILVLPHLGGWEWAGAHLASMGHPVSVVVERLEPPDVYEWFAGLRQGLGMNVIPAGPGAAGACMAALGANHVLGLLSDRLIAGTTGTEVEFFGERTSLPAGAATLALRSGATLLPAAVYFDPPTDSHTGVILPPLDTRRYGRLREDVSRVTQEMARALENLIGRAPTQWHLMQPNWPSDRA